ncbi:triose-phosphate isomerase [Acidisoma cladoniae]|jgi:triosephosphate isomerase|uniref:triose-phosphate isomerase n=1 Tax=Acidisoma cladoniae TaxID=3040935 RepID=UPI00254C5833|nr:triose-phosphate isomerase [Acidisoma sp. PAMC 29798]
MILRRKLVGTGWKMNHGIAEAVAYIDALRSLMAQIPHPDVDVFVLPPFTALAAAAAAADGADIAIGAQNVHWDDRGAWTGEISAPMLVEAGCRYVALAHSERLEHFGETYAAVRLKVNAALRHGLTPILCIGETGEDKHAGRADAVILDQVMTAMADQPADALPALVLAYEPRWAIGATAAADPDYVSDRLTDLRATLAQHFGAGPASMTRLLYGGSVTAANAPALAAITEVDGLFVGRYAWTAEGLAEIVAIVANAMGEDAS